MQFDAVPKFPDAKALSYFAVLESVLTHAPVGTDTVDTLTRQLKRSLVLLTTGCRGGADLQLDGFPIATPAQVINRLNSHRSALVHGGEGPKDLPWLEDRRQAACRTLSPRAWLHAHLRMVVRRVLVAALGEPVLVTDLCGA